MAWPCSECWRQVELLEYYYFLQYEGDHWHCAQTLRKTSIRGYSNGDIALVKAVESGWTDNVRALIKGGADVNAANKYGDPVLTTACERGYANIEKILVEAGAMLQPKYLHTICREFIRNHLLVLIPKPGLVHQVPQLPLPKAVKKFLCDY